MAISKVKRRWLDYALLAVPCVVSPLLVWAQNPVRVGHPERLWVIGIAAWALASLFLALARRLGAGRSVSLISVWLAALLFMRGGSFPQTYGYPLAILIGAAGLGVGVYLLARQSRGMLRQLVVVASVLLLAEVAFVAVTQSAAAGEDVSITTTPIESALTQKPDIVLIVADAYVGIDGLKRYFGVVDPLVQSELVSRGFEVPNLAFSSYATTSGGLASLLDMSFPIVAGPWTTDATYSALYQTIGGNNRLVHLLRENGYTATFVESGWSGSVCGPEIDICVPSSFFDESTLLALHKTWLGRFLLDRVGYSFTQGAMASADWLSHNLERITTNERPDFVMAHLEIPHPPLHLDADCVVDTARERRGVTLQVSNVDPEFRKQAYLDQARCVDATIRSLADAVGSEVVFVFVGDHGSDLHHQLARHPADWTADDTRERLNAILAVRTPGECSLSEPVLLVNLFPEILGCLGGEGLDIKTPRFFRSAAIPFDDNRDEVVELTPAQINELLTEPTTTSG